MKEQQAVAIS